MKTDRLLPLWLALPLLVAACGGASNANVFDRPIEGDDAAVGADTSGGGEGGTVTDTDVGGGKKDGGDTTDAVVVEDTAPPLTLDNVCARVADAYCTSSLSTCCASEGLAWKEGGCRDAITAVCNEQVAAAKKGAATFNPAAFDKCAAAWSSLATKCSVPALTYVKTYAVCTELFVGSVAPGGSCAADWQCKVPAGAYANCNRDGRCDAISIVGKDQPCVYSGNVRALCDYGLACAFASGTYSGKCRSANPLGSACSASWECGFGNFCERSGGMGSGKCVAGRLEGAGCYSNDVCASGSCVSSRCTDPNYTPASTFVCSGTG